MQTSTSTTTSEPMSRPVAATTTTTPASDTDAGAAIWLQCADDHRLAATLYRPAAHPRGAVLLAPAMGVPQRFYAAFASFLAEQGFVALSFDYRGMGRSRTRPLRRERADILTWAEQDAAAALRALRETAPGLPITWVGHSLGGQIAPMVPGIEAVERVVLVAAGTGYWRHNAPELRRKVGIFWFGAVPLLTPVFGYFPGARLGMVGDLPRGVIEQWRRWCMHPEYAVGAEGPEMRARFAALRAPLTSFSFTDDEMLSERNISVLYEAFRGAERRWVRVDPREAGLGRVGHFGFFRAKMRAPLWESRLLPELASLPS